MEAVFLRLLNMSIAAGWMILAVVLLRGLFKRVPRWIYCVLWAMVGLRLTCPFTLESTLSLIPSAETVPQTILHAQAPQIHSGLPVLNSAVNPVLSQALAPGTGGNAAPMETIAGIASVVWLAGMLVMLLYAAISYLRLRRLVQEAVLLRDELWICDHVESPFILGFARPRIYLPSDMEEQALVHVAAHERAHIRRRDHWWKPLGFLLLSVYWFHPLIWLAYVLLCRDIELACDEKVIREWGTVDKKAYSEALLRCSVSRRRVSACPLAFGEVGVKTRVRSVLHYKKPAFWVIVTAVLGCAVLAVCFLTNPVEDTMHALQPFGHCYRVADTVYAAPQYSFVVTPETAPLYCLAADYALLEAPQDLAERPGGAWTLCGGAQEVRLTKSNFDKYFYNNGHRGIWDGTSAGKLRRGNIKAWRVLVADDPNHVFYYILQQKDGSVYLAYGYYDEEGETDPMSDDSSIRWVFELAVEDGAGETSGERVLEETVYVASACLYMNPLSSVFPAGDTGYRYQVTDGSFVMIHRGTGDAESIAPGRWGWQELPYTQQEWEELFLVPEAVFDLSRYSEILYQPLSGQYSLLKLDGQLCLMDIHGKPRTGQFLWSIHTLVPESAMGSAQWLYAPVMSSRLPYFSLRFDLEFTQVTAVCDAGSLVGFEGTGASLTVPGGALHWSPQAGEMGWQAPAQEASVIFTVSGDAGTLYLGTVYITGEKTEVGWLYTARLVGNGLVLEQDGEAEGAVITTAAGAAGA